MSVDDDASTCPLHNATIDENICCVKICILANKTVTNAKLLNRLEYTMDNNSWAPWFQNSMCQIPDKIEECKLGKLPESYVWNTSVAPSGTGKCLYSK
jgi:hypothetical protein